MVCLGYKPRPQDGMSRQIHLAIVPSPRTKTFFWQFSLFSWYVPNNYQRRRRMCRICEIWKMLFRPNLRSNVADLYHNFWMSFFFKKRQTGLHLSLFFAFQWRYSINFDYVNRCVVLRVWIFRTIVCADESTELWRLLVFGVIPLPANFIFVCI